MQNAAELYAEKEKSLYIVTNKGRKFYADAPTFDTEEMAHALSMQCRYTGHTKEFYSVAEHCVLVSMMCSELPECYGDQNPLDASFEGLMHDAHEAYISDLAAPWKVLVPDYRAVEERFEAACRKAYGLPPGRVTDGVKRADWYALFLEARELLPPGISDDWVTPYPDFREQLNKVDAYVYGPRCWSPKVAKKAFLSRFYALSDERNSIATS
jgi:hypothetical protein